jgi:hypothetical protein
MRIVLEQVAARRGMIAYSELLNKLTTIAIAPFGLPMSEMLGEISEEEDAAGRGLLTVLVVHKSGDMEPGVGFYELAEKLGRDTSDRMKLWVSYHRLEGFRWKTASRCFHFPIQKAI